jgi:hypothetical protein
MTRSAYEHPTEDLKKLSGFAAIALATASTEKVLGAARRHPDVDSLLRGLVDKLWRWQLEEKAQGRVNMSETEAKALPSAKFYQYEAPLLALADKYQDQGKVYHLIGATIAALGFIIWQMDIIERAMNPGKPFVLGNDILEVDWETLAASLSTAVKAADDPDEMFAWQKAAIARLTADHPNASDPPSTWRTVPRDYFAGALALPDADPQNEPAPEPPAIQPPAHRYEAEELQERFTEHAAIAFATAAIERALGAVAAHPEIHAPLQELVDSLWKWEGEDKTPGKVGMSNEEAESFPSFQFYSRVDALRQLRDRYQSQPKIYALLSAVADSLVFISWLMDGIERRMNLGKPFVIGDEADERQWGALADALESAAKAAERPDQHREWQARTIQRLSKEHPGDPDGGVLGKPLSRNYFS